jgi:hypothetical protein
MGELVVLNYHQARDEGIECENDESEVDECTLSLLGCCVCRLEDDDGFAREKDPTAVQKRMLRDKAVSTAGRNIRSRVGDFNMTLVRVETYS